MALGLSRIGLRIAIPAVLVGVALLAGLYRIQSERAAEISTETLDVYADLINRMVLSDLRDAMLDKDRAHIQQELQRYAGVSPIRSLRIVDMDGKVAFATDPAVLGTLMQKSDPSCVTCHKPGVTPQRRARTLRFETPQGEHVYRAVQPILLDDACLRCHDAKEGESAGVLLIDLDDDKLTGAQREESHRTLWAGLAVALVVLLVLAIVLGRSVVFRLRHLRHLLDLLRSGARATVLSVGAADEIDDVTRAVQALTLDLDGRVGMERANRRLASVLERQSGPVLLIDARGWIVASNRLAVTRFAEGVSLLGQQATIAPGLDAETLAEAQSLGWSLPEDGDSAPAVLAMVNRSGDVAAYLALWMLPDDAAPLPVPPTLTPALHQGGWQLYGTVLAESIRPAPPSGHTVLLFDARLGRVRRLAADMAGLGKEALAERDEVDIQSLALIVLWDLKREKVHQHWHTLVATDARVDASRYQLRELMQRLASVAASQAGRDGHVVLFAHEDGRRLFLGAWAHVPGAQAVLDPPDLPALAHAVAAAHGGGVEVDPAFDVSTIPGFAALKMPHPPVGSLYVAELTMEPGHGPQGRPWHEHTMRT